MAQTQETLRLPSGPVWDLAVGELNWLAYRLAPGNAPGKLAKIPTTDGHDFVGADAAATMTFDQANAKAEALNRGTGAKEGEAGWCGIGYLPRPGAAMRAYDIDDCIDNGVLNKAAQEIVATGETFTEVSISGRGLRIWAAPVGDVEDDRGTEANGYGASGVGGKFFTFRGDGLLDAPTEIAPAPKTRHLVLDRARRAGQKADGEAWAGEIEEIDESAVERKLQDLLSQDEAFRRRWHGDLVGLNDVSRSASDFSVIGRLARHGFSFSETVYVMVEKYDQASAAVEKWRQGDERDMRRCYGRGRRKSAAEEFEPITPDMLEASVGSNFLFLPTISNVAPGAWIEEEERAKPDLDDLWLVDDILPHEGIGVLYGPPGSGKTFLALDIGLAIATGQPWMGRSVEQSDVVYVASEGGRRAARNRIHGWRTEHGIDDTRRFQCLAANFALMDGPDSLLRAVRDRGIKPRLVVVDTLNQNLGGGDENNSQDMGRFIAALKDIQRAFGCLVLVIHHSGKDGARGARGHSSLLGAADMEAEAAANVFKVTKSREGPSGMEIGFQLKRLVLGTSAKGREVTTCVAIPSSEALAKVAKHRASRGRSDMQMFALNLLRQLKAPKDFGGKAPTFDEWYDRVKLENSQLPEDEQFNVHNLKASLRRLCEGNDPLVRRTDDGRVEPASFCPAA